MKRFFLFLLSALAMQSGHVLANAKPRIIDVNNPVVAGAKKATRVAVIQYTSDRFFDDGLASSDPAVVQAAKNKQKALNHSNLVRYVRMAVARGARIIVLPEGSSFGYEGAPNKVPTRKDRTKTWCSPEAKLITQEFHREVFCIDPVDMAEPVPDGVTTRTWAKEAKDLSGQYGEPVYIVFSVIEEIQMADAKEQEKRGQLELFSTMMENKLKLTRNDGFVSPVAYSSSAVVVGPSGYETHHRKTARWQNEDYLATVRGLVPTWFDTPYGKFGLAVCLGFVTEDIFNKYHAEGVNAVLFPANYSANQGRGWVGASDHSFDFIAKLRKITIFGADDGESSRTGVHIYNQDTDTVTTLDEMHKLNKQSGKLVQYRGDGMIIVNIAY